VTAPAAAAEVPLWRGLDDIPAGFGPGVVTLGVFDGVHRGHTRLIERAVRLGRARRLPTVLVTFDPHPARVVGIARDTSTLSTVERRAELAADLGVNAVCVLPFTRELAAVPAEEFVERVLIGALRVAAVVVGANFTFGHRGAGDVDTMRRLGERHGFTADGVGLLEAVGAPCSSTYVRERLGRGDVRGAAHALGRPHRVEGALVAGTLVVPDGTAVPAPGRYAARLGCGIGTELVVGADGALRLTAAGAGQVAVDVLDRLTG